MQTKEVQQLLGIHKETLRFYEKEGLIKPSRNENDYRNYSDEDIRILRMILFLRSLEISLDEIKLILSGQIMLRDVLEVKKDFVEDEIQEKKNTLEKISRTLMRKKASFEFLEVQEKVNEENYVCFANQEIIIQDLYCQEFEGIKKYLYEDVKKIKLYICTRSYYASRTDGQIGYLRDRPHIGVPAHFFIDIDIYTKDNIYQFESTSIKNMNHIFELLKSKDVVIEDPLNLMNFFIEKQDKVVDLQLSLITALKTWQKDYPIDNPRSIDVLSNVSQITESIQEGKPFDTIVTNNDYKKYAGYPLYVWIIIAVIFLGLIVMVIVGIE